MKHSAPFSAIMPGDVERVAASAGRLFASKRQFTDSFYTHLFDALPEVRGLFSDDLSQQRDMVMMVLATTLKGISKPDQLCDTMERLARKHMSMGVTSTHLDIAADALTKAAQDVLQDAISHRSVESWGRIFHTLTGMMKSHMQMEAA